MRSTFLAVFLLLLCGCAEPVHWEKPGSTPEQFAADSAVCKKAVPMGGYFGSGIGATPTAARQMEEAYTRCMAGKGWSISVK